MRKLLAGFIALLLFSASAMAQTVQVSGRVLDSTGSGLAGASVREKGARNGVSAGSDGTFKISVKQGATLVISAVGYGPQEVAASADVSVSLKGDVSSGNLNEVVVTALGIRRRPKEIGYANSTVSADRITSGNSPTLGQALSGKVAGLTIQNSSSGVTQNVRITLRGNRSITGDNQALIVLDGVPVPSNTVNYINPNDIESITILKGGQAATLYGTDGVNGVLMITTKKGTNRRPTVNFQHSSTWDKISFMPDFQEKFGSGSDYGGAPNSIENYRPFENQQYGDPFNGQLREKGRVAADGTFQNLPYSAVPNNRKDAFNTGYIIQNDVSLAGGDDNSRFFMSAQDYSREGVVPGDKYRRDNVRFNASRTFGKFRASFDGTYAQDRQQTTSSSFYFNVLNTAPEINLKDYKDWRTNKFAGELYYNDYYPNPYFAADNGRVDLKNNYLNGNLQFEFKPLDWFTASYRIGTAITNSFEKDFTGQLIYNAYTRTAPTHSSQYNDYNGRFYANANILGSVSDIATNSQRLNSDLILNFNRNFSNFSTKLLLGNTVQRRYSQTSTVSSNSLVVPGLYNIGNRSGDLTGSASISDYRKYSYFGDLTVGYNDYLFLHGSIRNDNTSLFYRDTAARSKYSYLLYGIDASFVVTDAFKGLSSHTLTSLKLRGGYNTNYNDNLNPYEIDPTFANATGSPFGTIVGLTTGNTFPSLDLKPERVRSVEIGLEATLFNRINLDVSAYKQKSDQQIISAGVSSATGYTNYRVNAANLKNKGLEVELRANILRGKNLSWDVNANYTYNINEVVSIFQGLPRFQAASYSTYGYLFAEIGQPFPLLKTSGFQTDSLGRTIVSKTDGWPLRDVNLHPHGNTLPKHTIGFGTRVAYKGFTFSTNLEYRTGYVIYNAIGHDLAFTGSGALTAQYDRKPFLYPNSSYTDGANKFVANTDILVNANWAWYDGYGNVGQPRAATQIGDFFVTSGRFLKVRDAAISYSLPASLLGKTKVIKGATITLVGRNLLTLLPSENIYTDPEFSAITTSGAATGSAGATAPSSSSNAQGINTSGAALNAPPTRSYGFTLNVNF